MTTDYDVLLGLLADVAAAEKKAADAAVPWEKLAYEVAKETRGLESHGEVRFEKTRFRIACQGTGIYSHEAWWEDFPIELLLAKMRQSQDRKES